MKPRIISWLIFVVLNLYSNTTSQMIGFGTCPQSKDSVQNFQIIKYTGIWFEQFRYFLVPEISTTCSQANITHSEHGPLEYQISYYDSWDDNHKKIKGIAKIDGSEGEGKFEIDFTNKFSMEYRVIDTDYESYTVVSTCVYEDGYYARNTWIFTREQYPSNKILNAAIKVLKRKRIPTKFMHKIDQSICNKIEIDFDPDAEYIDDYYINNAAEEI